MATIRLMIRMNFKALFSLKQKQQQQKTRFKV